MAKLLFDDCCFCIELRLGCFIIAYLNLVGSAAATIVTIFLVALGAALTASTDEQEHEAGLAVLIIGIVTLLAVALLLTFAIVLLVGLHKKKPRHLLAYLGYSVFFLVLNIILFIASAVEYPTAPDIVIRLIGILFNVYIILVIRSYYYKLLEEARPVPPVHHLS